MIRKILLAFAILSSGVAFGQQQNLISGEDRTADIKEYDFRKNVKANRSTAWFNMYQDMKNISSNYSTYLDYLFPDSTVQWVGNSGGVFVWKNAQGQVLDPTSNYWVISTATVSKDATYRLDSIALPYVYRRTQSANADTLLIQIIEADNMGYVPDPGWTPPRSYCRPDYDSINRKAIGATKEFKVPLTDSDTAISVSRLIQLEVGIDVQPDAEIAATVHYIPGNPYNPGDTLSFTGNGPGTINSFAIWDGKDGGQLIDMYHYNHSLFITKDIAHNSSSNGWNGRYIPGVAYTTGFYYTNIYFLITYDDFSSIKNEEGNIVLNINPNPATQFVNVDFDIQNTGNATLDINDIYGRKVYSKRLDVNSSNFKLDVSKWNRGMYIYTLKNANNVLGSGRILLVD